MATKGKKSKTGKRRSTKRLSIKKDRVSPKKRGTGEIKGHRSM